MLCTLQSSKLVGKFISNWKAGSGWTAANILLFYGSFYAEQCVYLLKLDPNINLNTHVIIFPFQGVVVWVFFLITLLILHQRDLLRKAAISFPLKG